MSGDSDDPSTNGRRKTNAMGEIVRALRHEDDETVQQLVLSISHRSRLLAPLALVVGAFVMLGRGLKLLVTNWRLALLEALPASWIWVAMFDLRVHVLHGQQFHVIRGPLVILLMAGVVILTAVSFYLNAVFAFTIANGGSPRIHLGFAEARKRIGIILGSGVAAGLLVAFASLVVVRWGLYWFAIAMSIATATLMVSYIAIPSRLTGLVPAHSRRDKWAASAIVATLSAIICLPPYLLGRAGVGLMGIRGLFLLGVIILTVGVALHAGASGAVKSIKLSASLVGSRNLDVAEPVGTDSVAST
jgi:hypothetical protein